VAGALLIYSAGCNAFSGGQARGEGEDEERPPIIVRNGSLIFESGDAASNDPEEKTGKPWKQVDGSWQPDHNKGKKTKWFVVTIQGGTSGACPGAGMTQEIVITYTKDSTDTKFTIKPKGRNNGGNGPKAPAIETTATLQQGGSSANPQLIFDPVGGAISNVSFQSAIGENANCMRPQSLKIWQF
jgi:hypothetical protein